MADSTPRLYEGMFLVSQAAVTNGLDACLEKLNGFFARIDAEVLALRKWEDRKLAYTIDGQKRGTYLIAYFKAVPTSLIKLERDLNLEDDVIRVMFTRCDHFGEIELHNAVNDIQPEVISEEGEASEAPAEPATVDA
ncbi:MAG: 30S ribosomal protein S6 [Planctomycetota bacterium]